ncbi:MAG: hypothetical protein D6701_04690 [Gemmatimonadetes bacterium]|nr:MAG: hypothetical protein D6701_04690 [Gemmatimonadota bacterium]
MRERNGTRPGPSKGFGARVRGLALGALLLAAAAAAVPLGAQSGPPDLDRLRLEYQAAVSALRAAQDALALTDRDWQAWIDSVDVARSAGDDGRYARAQARVQEISPSRASAIDRVERLADAVREARDRLRAGLASRLARLYVEADSASPARFRELQAQVRDLENQVAELDREDDLTQRSVTLAHIAIDPIDGPEDILAKAEILDRRARQLEIELEDVDRRLTDLEGRARFRRIHRDALANTDRFGDGAVPIGSQTRRTRDADGEAGIVPGDSARAGQPLTLEEQIARLRAYRAQLEQAHDELLGRAREFRRVAGPEVQG